MSRLQVLVTTMHQSGIDKYHHMNLQTDAIIANQCAENSYFQQDVCGRTVQMVSTATRGLARNRNIALSYASQKADLVMFSDDDLVFNDGYESVILKEFEEHPEAEAIQFYIHDLSGVRKSGMSRSEKFEKATRRSVSIGGVCGLVLKVEAIKKNNLRFHENFGTGTDNYCGEDTIFLMDMLDKKVKIYRSPVDIAGIDQTESTWYEGRTERYFTTAGMVIGTCYPILSYLIVIRSAYRAHKRKDGGMGFAKILACYYRGIRKHT